MTDTVFVTQGDTQTLIVDDLPKRVTQADAQVLLEDFLPKRISQVDMQVLMSTAEVPPPVVLSKRRHVTFF